MCIIAALCKDRELYEGMLDRGWWIRAFRIMHLREKFVTQMWGWACGFWVILTKEDLHLLHKIEGEGLSHECWKQ